MASPAPSLTTHHVPSSSSHKLEKSGITQRLKITTAVRIASQGT